MKAKRLLKLLVPAVAVTMGVSSCQDYDAGFNEKSIQYTDEFKEAFGDIDPNQDWSLATQITAHVTGVEDGMMEIFYSDPIGGQPVMLTMHKIEGGNAEFRFDVVKGTKQIYVRINNGTGYYPMKSNFKIENGVVNISPATTRAAVPTGTSRVTRGTARTLSCSQLLDWSKKDNFHLQAAPSTELKYIDGYYADNEHDSNVNGSTSWFTTGNFTNVIPLYDVISEDDERPEWYVKDIAHFFEDIDGEEGVFKEGQNHVQLMKDGATPHLEKDLVFTMEENGPFYLDYFFKGTKYDNQFGYFYFTGDIPTREEFMSIPKFILVDNMSAYPNPETRTTKVTINQEKIIDWNLLQSKLPLGNSIRTFDGVDFGTEGNWDTKIVGTRFQLTYFGSNGTDATGTYTFPKDTKIGLFFIGNHDDGRDNEIITSISKLNLDLYDETPHAASFQYNEQVVFAMEDMRWGGDADVNDAMFIANGTFKKTEIPNIKPTEPTYPTWVMACEDLGGTFDYDFNDLVFGLRMTPIDGENSKLELIPLAAGGTLNAEIYYGSTRVGEIHDMVRSGAPTDVPLNVTPGATAVAGTPVTLAESISSSTSVNDIATQIKIKVTKDEENSENSSYNIGYHWNETGYEAPQVLLLSPGWEWPSENTFICDIYEDFDDWTGDAGVQGSWVANKKGTKLVHNPLPAVVTPPSTGEGGESGEAPDTPSTPTATDAWNINVSGYASMEKLSKQIVTITIDGVNDYSNMVVGTYSNTVIKATKKTDTTYEIEGLANGTALLYVKMPADDTHKLTRKDYEIKVTNPMPEFSFKIGNTVIGNGDTYTHTWNGGYDFVSGTLTLTKGTDYRMQYSSSNTSVVEASAQGLNVKGAGTAEVTIKHQEGSDGSTVWEEKSITFTVVINAPGTGGGPTSTDDPQDETPVEGGASVAINGTSTNVGYSFNSSNGVYSFNKSHFADATKVTVVLSTNSSNNMDACVYKDNYTDSKGVSYNAKGTKQAKIVIEDSTVLNDIKNSGLPITDWSIQWPDGKGHVESISITVE